MEKSDPRDVGELLWHRSSGVLLDDLGEGWVAFSSISGETCLLNNECAAVLEVLADGPATIDQICGTLGADVGLPVETLRIAVLESWPMLREIGLIAAGPEDAGAAAGLREPP